MTHTNHDESQNPQHEAATESKRIPPGSYLNLPPVRTKHAPKIFKGDPEELESFLDAYSQLCLKENITSSRDQYKGLLKYCKPSLVRTLKGLPSSDEEDYDLLLQELQYFYGEELDKYSITSVRQFTKSWRHRGIRSLATFKQYYWEYVELAGRAKKHRKISTEDYNRYFWEGLNESLRVRLENRMLATDPEDRKSVV